MAKLYFDIGANYEEAEKLANTIADLEKKLAASNKQTDPALINAWSTQLKAAQISLAGMVETAAKSGKEVENLFKNINPSDIGEAFQATGSTIKDTKKFVKGLSDEIEKNNKEIEESKQKIKEYAKEAEKAFNKGDDSAYKKAGDDIETEMQHLNALTTETEGYQNALNTLTGVEEENTEVKKKNSGMMEKLMGGTKNYNDVVRLLPSGLKRVVSGINGITKASLKFLATPIGVAIAGIALALASLKTWLTKTEEGEMAMAKATGFLKGILVTLENTAINIGKALADAFKTPQDAVETLRTAISKLWETIKARPKEILDDFTGFFKGMGSFFKVLKNKGSLKEAFNAWGEDIEDTPAFKRAEKVANKVKDKVDEAKDNIKKSQQLELDKLAFRKQKAGWEVTSADLQSRMSQYQQLYQNTALNSEIRKRALDEYAKLLAEKNKGDAGIAWGEANLIKREQGMVNGNTVSDTEQYSAAVAAAKKKEKEGEDALKALVRSRNQIIKEGLQEEKEMQKLSLEEWENQLNLEEDSTQKQLDLLMVSYEKKLDEISQMAEKWRNSNGAELTEEEKKIVRSLFSDMTDEDFNDMYGGLTLDQANMLNSMRKQAMNTLNVGRRDMGNSVYEQFKAEEDKKKDLEKQYNDDMLALQTAYNTTADEKFRRSMEERTKAYKSALMEMEQDTSATLALIFGNVDLMTKNTLDKAIVEAQKMISQYIANGDVEKAADVRNQLDKLMTARDNYSFNGWGGSLMDLLKVRSQKNRLTDQKSGMETDMSLLEEGSEKWRQLANEVAAADEGIKKLTEDEKKAVVAFSAGQLGDTLSKIGSALKEIANATGDEMLSETAEGFSEIGGVVNNIANGFATGGLFGGIAAAAGTLVDTVTDMVVSVKVQDAEFKKFTENFEDRIDKLKYKVKDYDSIFGTDSLNIAADAYVKALTAMDEYIKASQELKDMSFKSKDYSWWNNLFGKSDQYSDLKDYDIWGEDGLLDPDKAQAFLDVWGSKLNEEQTRAIENAIELAETYEDLKDTVKDFVGSLTGDTVGTIADEMIEKFISTGNAIVDMTDNLQDFKKKLASSIVQSMLLKNVFTQQRQDEISRMLMDNNVQGAIESYNALLNQANEYSGEIQTFLAGLNIQDYVDQSATGGAFQTMSQDQASELNGRFTALQIYGEHIDENMGTLVFDFETFVSKFTSQFIAVDDIRNIQAQSLIELQGINENTLAALKPIREMNTTINDIKRKVEKL